MDDNAARGLASRMKAERPTGAGLSAALVGAGAGLGMLLAGLQVATDPHLRPVAWHAWLQALPAALPTMMAAALIACGAAILFGGTTRAARGARVALLSLVPAIGLGLWAVSSPRFAWALEPRHLGAVLSGADRFLMVAAGLMVLLCILPAVRFAPSLPQRRARLGTLLCGFGLILALLPALRQGSAPPPSDSLTLKGRLVLIGLDGVDWQHLNPRIERGLMPNLAGLVESGASGPLGTFRPTLSPMIWTTIATGHAPIRHGILDFLEAETRIPYTSNSRRVPAIWNLLGEAGLSVGVAGWWVTWPAEVVHGAIVSSYSTPEEGTIKPSLIAGVPRQTHPPDLMAKLEGQIAQAREDGRAELNELLTSYRPPAADTRWAERKQVSNWVLGADRIFADAATVVLEAHSPDFLATYFSASDTTLHVLCQSNPWRDQICERVVDLAYSSVDRRIGEVLSAAGPDATVLVVSDHGFDLTIGHEHGLLQGMPGIAILSGPGIRSGSSIEAATIYDVAPTVLALAGARVPADLRGRAWLGVLEPERLAEIDLQEAPSTWRPAEAGDAERYRPRPAHSDDAMRDRLRALGYIE